MDICLIIKLLDIKIKTLLGKDHRLEKDHNMIETRHLKNLVIFVQNITYIDVLIL